MVARCAEMALRREQVTAGSVMWTMWTLDTDFRDDGFNSQIETSEILISGENPKNQFSFGDAVY